MREINQDYLKYLILLVLKEQKGKIIPISELVNRIADDKLSLSEDEKNEHYDGRTNDKKFYKMVATNEQRLKAAGLENFYKTGHKITEEGIKAVDKNQEKQEISYDYLRSIPEYNEWEERLGIAPKDRKKLIENDNIFVAPIRKNPSRPKSNSDLTFNEIELRNVITNIKDNFKRLEWYYRLYEENVRVELVEPILKAIGWVAPFIRREERNMDYLLSDKIYLNDECYKLIIEVKKYQEQLKTTGEGEKTSPVNEYQLLEYCRDPENNPLAGILTNGIRWCIYLGNGYDYKGEIDLRYTDIEECIRFFRSISKNEFYTINELDWEWLTKSSEKTETHPTKISINGKPYGTLTDAYFEVVKKFINEHPNPSDFVFFKKVILKERKGQYKEYTNDNNKIHIVNVKYGVYDMIALMQTINATLDSVLTITIE